MNLTTVISTEIDNLTRRLVKVLRIGRSDVRTPFEAVPYGIDSNPIKDMVAVYSETAEKGKDVIVGYLNKNQLADVGESRMYATDANGNLKLYVWLKADGTMELGGTADNAVRYQKLSDATTAYQNKVITELGKISAAIALLGGSYTVGDVSFDISQAKINEIKTL